MDKFFIREMTKSESSSEENNADHEIKKIEKNFIKALTTLKSASKRIGRRFNLYDMPWYAIIGPPGSGKTTALINSGLNFPLSENSHASAIRGVSGTRDCDWWFSDQAILIDTSGRYTTQDSQSNYDRKSWLGFLKLLKKFRPKQPINGIIIAVSVNDILNKNSEERKHEAKKIRLRIVEIQETLGINFPIYFILTKMDMLDGFDIFFDHYSEVDRQQIWGFELPSKPTINNVQNGFYQLIEKLNSMLVPIMGLHKNMDDLKSIYSYPKQIESISHDLSTYIFSIFESSYYNTEINFRGIYLSSGTQEGEPIDRLMKKIGNNRHRVESTKGKSFFINNLLKNHIFSESHLVGTDRILEKRNRIFSIATIATLTISSLLLAIFWLFSYFGNLENIETIRNKLVITEKTIRSIDSNNRDPLITIPALNELLGIKQQLIQKEGYFNMGLSQTRKLKDQINLTYNHLLINCLLPRLMIHSEDKLINMLDKKNTKNLSESQNSYLYVALRNYLMLNTEEKYSADEVNAFYRLDWLNRIQSSLSNEQVDDIKLHLDNLFLKQPVPLPLRLNQKIIERTRGAISPIPIEKLAINRIEQMDFLNSEPFNVYNISGKKFSNRVFKRKDGESLNTEIPKTYTKSAYLQLMANGFKDTINEVVDERWVLGEAKNNNDEKESIYNKVNKIYLENYLKKYTDVANSLILVDFESYRDAANIFEILSSSESPLLKLVEAIEKETKLTANINSKIVIEDQSVSTATKKLKTLLGYGKNMADKKRPMVSKDIVTKGFEEIHNLIEKEDESGTQSVSAVIAQFDRLYKIMEEMAVAESNNAITPELSKKISPVTLETQVLAQQMPSILIKSILISAVNNSRKLSSGGMITHINQEWSSGIQEFCHNAIDGRFPFVKTASKEVSLADFSEFFGYGGLLDNFFNEHLSEYIDTNSKPWVIHKKYDDIITISPETLDAFQNAKDIRKAFFMPSSKNPESNFTLTPIRLNSQLQGVFVSVDGQGSLYEFGPLEAKMISWPNTQKGGTAKIEFRQIDGKVSASSKTGEWAWFRLLANNRIDYNDGNGSYNVTFRKNLLDVTYKLIPATAYNPYRLFKKLKFLCPSVI